MHVYARFCPLALLALAPLLVQAAAEPTDVPDEKVLPAAKAPSDAPLRPVKGMSLYKLTNLRVAGTELVVSYVVVSGTAGTDGPGLALRFPDGKELFTISARQLAARSGGKLGPGGDKKGKTGGAPPANAGQITVDAKGLPGGLPANLEVYAITADPRLEKAGLMSRFKVSNSLIAGKMDVPRQQARDWKDEERKLLDAPPPPAGSGVPLPNTTPINFGRDTAFAGATAGRTLSKRFADAAKRPVIGLMYATSPAFKGKAEKAAGFRALTPAYQVDQPTAGSKPVLANEGYAVGGLNVKTQAAVTGLQVVFMKKKPDGSLDLADTYESEWLGSPGDSDKEVKLTGKGKKIIGIHVKTVGASVVAIALVQE